MAGTQEATSLRLVGPEALSPVGGPRSPEASRAAHRAQTSEPRQDLARSDQSGVRLLYRHTPVPKSAGVDLTVLLDLEEIPNAPRASAPPPVPSAVSTSPGQAQQLRVDLEQVLSSARMRMPMSPNRWEDLFESAAWDRPTEPPKVASDTRESWVGRLGRRFGRS